MPPSRSIKGRLRKLWDALHLFVSETDTRIKVHLSIALLFALIASSLTALAPVALQMLVDALSLPGGNQNHVPSILLVLAYVVSQWLARSFTELRIGAYGHAEQRLQRRLSHRMFAHVMSLPLAFHLSRRTGALNQTLINGLMGSRIVLTHFVFTLVPVIVQLATVASVLLYLNQPAYLLVIFVSVVAYGLTFAIGVAQIAGPARDASATTVDSTGLMTDAILNYETVKYSDAETLVDQRYDAALERTEGNWTKFYNRRTSNGLAVAGIFAISLAVTVSMAAQGVRDGTLSLGEFILVNTYILQIVRPLEMIGFAVRDITQGLAFVEKLLDLLQERSERRTPEFPPAKPSTKSGELVFDRVRFSYDRQRPLHNNLTFRCPAGQTVALVGPSGSGKSTIIRLILRLFEPNEGRVTLDDVPIANWPISDLRRAIAVVPQDTVLFNDTIAFNIAFGYADKPQQDIERAARLANIHEFISSLPDGYETVVGERGMKLSGGEKQRIAIARAVLKQPRIFVFDEATSSLDTRTERAILANLRDVSRNVTTLFVAHRLSTIVHADKILVIENGQIVEHGSHGILLERGGRYAEMWRAQQHHRNEWPGTPEEGNAILA